MILLFPIGGNSFLIGVSPFLIGVVLFFVGVSPYKKSHFLP